MYRSWGFSTEAVALSVAVTGVWNVFMKLGLPIIAVALLAIEGQVSAALVAASLVGVAMLAVSILLFGLVLRYETLAQRIGDAFAIVASSGSRPARSAPSRCSACSRSRGLSRRSRSPPGGSA